MGLGTPTPPRPTAGRRNRRLIPTDCCSSRESGPWSQPLCPAHRPRGECSASTLLRIGHQNTMNAFDSCFLIATRRTLPNVRSRWGTIAPALLVLGAGLLTVILHPASDAALWLPSPATDRVNSAPQSPTVAEPGVHGGGSPVKSARRMTPVVILADRIDLEEPPEPEPSRVETVQAVDLIPLPPLESAPQLGSSVLFSASK